MRRGQGVLELQARFEPEQSPPTVQNIVLSTPTQQPKKIMELLRLSTETLRSGAGFIAIELIVMRSQRVCFQQSALIGDEEADAEQELSGLIERLRARLGETIVTRPRLIPSHIPERAFEWTSDLTITSNNPIADAIPARPVILAERPVEIGVVVTPSDDRTGRPISFTHQGRVHRLRLAIGPERIAGEWWNGHNKTRDYFDVEDETGRRFWVFRVGETFKWYLHGRFA
jgi:protein ImuB